MIRLKKNRVMVIGKPEKHLTNLTAYVIGQTSMNENNSLCHWSSKRVPQITANAIG